MQKRISMIDEWHTARRHKAGRKTYNEKTFTPFQKWVHWLMSLWINLMVVGFVVGCSIIVLKEVANVILPTLL